MSDFATLPIDATFVVDLSSTGRRDWPARYQVRDARGSVVGGLEARKVVGNHLEGSYPVGIEDREVRVDAGSSPAAVGAAVHALLTDAARCRRVVLAVPEGQLEALAAAEEAGFRFVVDIDTHQESLSLLVAEPEWVLAQPSAIEEIPL
ncbi:hypothetical protein E3T55_06665 [Cryobacterium frigoriphilum]|uniref:Uncharacterized protein n=1 Tax=Cryobacterium frigoriphilum TaxID=1259150 RepID=A0A4R9A5C2_9MICO|nr:hypothetical protein [Cryobacterium frigoriphilum]TFD52280.1 hypothetical protein E3T55_06665 [Cryobacterium frigoriphilum]